MEKYIPSGDLDMIPQPFRGYVLYAEVNEDGDTMDVVLLDHSKIVVVAERDDSLPLVVRGDYVPQGGGSTLTLFTGVELAAEVRTVSAIEVVTLAVAYYFLVRGFMEVLEASAPWMVKEGLALSEALATAITEVMRTASDAPENGALGAPQTE